MSGQEEAAMKACFWCGIDVSGLELYPCWDKDVHKWILHLVCRDCRGKAKEAWNKHIDELSPRPA